MNRWMERSWEHLTSWSISVRHRTQRHCKSVVFCPAAGTKSETRNKYSRAHTMEAFDALGRNSQQCILDVAARLEGAPVGVNVDVSHGSLDADAAVRGPSGVGV